MLKRRLAGKLDFRRGRAAQATVDLVAFGVHGRLRFGKHSFLDQEADPRMIPRLGDHLAAAHLEQPRVAGVRPACHVVLNDAGDAGGARRVTQTMAHRIVKNGMMGVGQALLQEAEGVIEGWPRLALEAVGQRLHGDLGGDLAVVMTAHSVRNHHQERFARVAVGGPVLVVGAPSLAAVLIDRESHR